MPTPEPVSKSAEAVARDSFMEPHAESDEAVRGRCHREGVVYEEVVRHLDQFKSEFQTLPTVGGGGDDLEGRFEIEEQSRVVSGGQGVVRYGREKATGRRVAVKQLRLATDDTLDERGCPPEVVAIERIHRHTTGLRRNLVEYLAHGYWNAADRQASERAYTVVMEAAAGTLKDVLAAGPLVPDVACRLLVILAGVVDGFQRQTEAVIHRDLKPANVLLYDAVPDDPPEVCWEWAGVRYRPVVTDFGLAKRVDPTAKDASLTAAEHGTPNYMAPEQHRGGHLTPPVDIYALGVMLVECVTGKVPFDFLAATRDRVHPNSGESNTRLRVLHEPAPTLDSLTEGRLKHARLERVARRCLRKGPHRRYQTGAELVADLRRVLEPAGPPLAAETLSRTLDEQDRMEGDVLYGGERRGRKRWQRVAGLGLIGLVVLGAVAAAVGFTLQAEATSHRTTRMAKTRLLQDASLDRERAGDHGTAAVLLSLALQEAAGLDPSLEGSLRTAITIAHARLLPLRGVLDDIGRVRGCALTSDGRVAAVATDQAEVWLIDTVQGELARAEPYSTGPYSKEDTRNSAAGVAFDPVRPRFAVATNSGAVHLVNRESMKLVAKVAFPGQPRSVHYSPDGTYLVIAGRPEKDVLKFPDASGLVVFDAESGAPVHNFHITYDLYEATFSPDGGRIVAGGGGPPHPLLTVWDWKSSGEPGEKREITLQHSRVFTLAFRPGFKAKLVTGDTNGGVRFWDLTRPPGREVDGTPLWHDKQVRVTGFSEDGTALLVGGEDGTAQLWDVETRLPIGQRLHHFGEVRAGGVSSTAGRVVTGGFGKDVRVWDFHRSEAERAFTHPSPVWEAVFDASGNRIFTGCAAATTADGEKVEGRGQVWDLTTGTRVELLHGADVMAARFRPGSSGEVVTCGNDGAVRLWDVTGVSPKPLDPPQVYEGGKVIHTATFDPDGKHLAVAGADGVVQEFEYDSSARQLIRAHRWQHKAFSWVWNLRYTANGRLLSDGGAVVCGWQRGQSGSAFQLGLDAYTEAKVANEMRLGAVDDRRGTVITSDMEGNLVLWLAPGTGATSVAPKKVLPGQPHGRGQLCAAVRDRDGRIATGGPDGVVRLWTADGTDTGLSLRHPSIIGAVEFSPDGRWLATACRDGGVRLWAADSGVWTGAGWYHAGPVTRVQFSPDGTRLLTAGRDGVARVSQIPDPQQGTPDAIHARTQADAGVQVTVAGDGAAATYAPPQPLTTAQFLKLRATGK